MDGDQADGTAPLAFLRRGFDRLLERPDPLAIAGGRGLPDRPVPLDELRDLLADPRCAARTRDRAWVRLLQHARAQGGAWTVGCAGVALPALEAVTTRLLTCAIAPADPQDVEAEVIAGFLAAVATVRLDRPGIADQLRLAAFLRGLGLVWRRHPDPVPVGRLDQGDRVLASIPGHPDLLLAAAVADGVLTQDEGELVGATRLEGVGLAVWAAAHDIPLSTASRDRRRAEARLVPYLHARAQAR
jgi:hypothetical protein